ncbi:MAG: chromate transporter [Planctomycetota bacterium]|nr:MAG: chromate transporter [Planctomycetota bacterium]REK26653.1 MAG: chromate transporter [Planctomycetota bacterium]REK35688.1 MAG: chromate transporter [Planctomycetota bacterium]
MPPAASPSDPTTRLPFSEALRVWCRVAALSFGGPAGQIAVMHRILVDEKKWLSEERFLHALNYCMLLPGPEAQQLATYTGWLLHGTPGGLVAGLLFILPGFVSILTLSILYALYHDLTFVQALFFGLKPAVVAIVIEAVIRIGRRALRNRFLIGIAAAAFIAIFFLEVPFPAIVLGGGIIGWLGGRWHPSAFLPPTAETDSHPTPLDSPTHARPTLGRTLSTATIWLTVWWAPIAALWLFAGEASILTREGFFFSQVAVVTFGGAYAALAYVADVGVSLYGWLQPGEMLDGLGMAETTPGPLIQVVQFVGFMGAYRNPGPLSPLAAGVFGSVVTTWATFAPCFLWIFTGAPYIESLRGRPGLNSALSAITACVVGVVLNLSIWFALHTLFGEVHERHAYGLRWFVPEWSTLNTIPLLLAAAAFIALFRFQRGMIETLATCTVLGMCSYLLLH